MGLGRCLADVHRGRELAVAETVRQQLEDSLDRQLIERARAAAAYEFEGTIAEVLTSPALRNWAFSSIGAARRIRSTTAADGASSASQTATSETVASAVRRL